MSPNIWFKYINPDMSRPFKVLYNFPFSITIDLDNRLPAHTINFNSNFSLYYPRHDEF